MSRGRWDAVLEFLDGPLARWGEQVYRGPVIRIGVAPGEGVVLPGVRGVDARHAVITTYDGQPVIEPVGRNQVRLAPHPRVDWREFPPLTAPALLPEGAWVHLGPPGRGATFRFVACRQLGAWEERALRSEAGGEEAPAVEVLSSERGVPGWFIGGLVLVGLLTAGGILAALVHPFTREVAGLGPVEEGQENYDAVSLDEPLDPELRQGLGGPWYDFVQRENGRASGRMAEARDPGSWDQPFLDQVARSFERHSRAWSFFERLEKVTGHYAYVVQSLRAAGLPEVFAGIPYRESRYSAEALSPACARGWWQFMPETAIRMGLEVRDCRIAGRDEPWTPTRLIPPYNAIQRAPYVRDRQCIMRSCAVDERTDLQASTRAAIAYLEEPLSDPLLQDSGAVVQLAITAFNAGYDDSRFEEGRVKEGNVLPAYRRYLRDKGLSRAPGFLGDNIRCPAEHGFQNQRCGAYLYDQSQHYAYNVIAQHFLAVCYYGLNHAELPAFSPWRRYAEDGYCKELHVPTAEQVRERMGR